MSKKALIIGAGPAGSTSARIFAEKGWMVHLYEKRNHIAGNCYDEYDDNGVLVHMYGPHYFRTNSLELLQWLSNFTDWIPGRYYVRASVNGKLVPLPISLATITMLKGKPYDEEKFHKYLDEQGVSIARPKNAEEQCLALVGQELYKSIFEGYTKKQWGLDPSELSPSITARIPLRFNWDERYVNEKYQVIPRDGYTEMFQRILDHANIIVKTNYPLSPSEVRKLRIKYNFVLYTGPIDSFFDFRFGELGYRSLKFEWNYLRDNYKQPCVQINYPNNYKYTRTVEIKHVTGQNCEGTTICYEYPQSLGDPFYPILNEDNKKKYLKYKALADELINQNDPIYFLGRLAEFRYFNMDHVFIRSMKLANKILNFHK